MNKVPTLDTFCALANFGRMLNYMHVTKQHKTDDAVVLHFFYCTTVTVRNSSTTLIQGYLRIYFFLLFY